MTKFLCPDTNKLLVKGEFQSKEFAFVDIKVKGCDLGEDCAPQNLWKGTHVNFSILNSFIDLQEQDANKVVKHAMLSQHLTTLDGITAQKRNIYFM